MKKLIFGFFFFFVLLSLPTFAQNTDLRSNNTRIADLLSQMPAPDSAHWNSNMADMAVLGQKGGLLSMLSLLSAPGEGNNSRLEYAITGFSSYVMKPGNEAIRKLCINAYSQLLEKLTNRDNQAFIISQLGLVGDDDAVPLLKKYVPVKELCDPSCQALLKINTLSAKDVLLENLQNAQGESLISLIQAIGVCKYKKAIPFLHFVASGTDALQIKVSLSALAQIADPQSEKLLFEAAKAKDFHFESSLASASFINYLQNLAKNGNALLAKKKAKWILANCIKDDQLSTRIGALKIVSDLSGLEDISALVKASADKNPVYREAALRFALPLLTEKNVPIWVAHLKNPNPDVQTSVIHMLGSGRIHSALSAIIPFIKASDKKLRFAALVATGKLGHEKVLPNLINGLRKGDREENEVIKNILLSMHGNTINQRLGDVLASMPSTSKVTLINVLESKGANTQLSKVYPFLHYKDTLVSKAVFHALKNLVNHQDLDQLFYQINHTNDTGNIHAVQYAIIEALKGIREAPGRSRLILKQMEQSAAEQKRNFFIILANIGGTASLKAISDAFDTGNKDAKKQAIEALVNWSDGNAKNVLFRIAVNYPEYSSQALGGYLKAIINEVSTDDQKLLLLKKGLAIVRNGKDRSDFIRETGKLNTFSALVLAGKYLDDPETEQVAAAAVMNIALDEKSAFSGKIVYELLNKTRNILKGPDNEYQKESIRKFLAEMPQNEGFVSIFNGRDLSGWNGFVGNPVERSKMAPAVMTEKQKQVNEGLANSWQVVNGDLVFTGKGNNLVTEKKYGDFEMLVDWKIEDDGSKKGDGGIYLRGTPQVQIWDTSRRDVGAGVGSGGLYNNKINQHDPITVADNPVGEWNSFRILMIGEKVTVYLNGMLVADQVKLENYWSPGKPIYPEEFVELQAHGSRVSYRNIYIREITQRKPFELSEQEKKEGFTLLFDGTNLDNWVGNKTEYVLEDGNIVIRPIMAKGTGSGGNLYSKNEYADFNVRFEFKLTAGANNGLGVRAPLQGDAAYLGMEIQMLDNDAEIYKNLHDYQYHGSVYGVIPAKRGYLKPVGEWNYEEVIVKGTHVKVILNNTVILDGDIAEASANGTPDHLAHPGLKEKKGHIGFLGHGAVVSFRNIRIKEL